MPKSSHEYEAAKSHQMLGGRDPQIGRKAAVYVGHCYDFKRFRQSSTVVGSKVRGQMSLEECKS